jgi:quinohemoprotein ethanol dehydrogenase
MDYFYNIVLDGALKDAGMPSFKSALTRDDVTAIRNFVIHRANQDSRNAAPTPH